jgi:hypothetical protein
MRILIVYFFCVLVGQALALGIGLLIDPYSKTVALAVFIPIYYAMYWVAWRVSLFIVERTGKAEPDSTEGRGGPGAAVASVLLAPAVLVLDLCD